MIEKTYIDLINKEIDGVNSQEDSDKLEAYLAENPEAQDLYDDLLSMSTMLNKTDEIDPSPTLKKNILDSIPQKKYAAREKKRVLGGARNFLKSLIPTQAPRSNFRYAYAFSAGLIVGIVALFLVFDKIYQTAEVDVSNLYGAMMLPGSPESLETADYAEINLDQVYGEIHTSYSKDIVLTELDLSTRQECEIVLEFDDDDISFQNFTRLSDRENKLDIGTNYLRLSSIGDNRYVIVFRDKSESVTLMRFKIFVSGDLVYEKDVSTGHTTNF